MSNNYVEFEGREFLAKPSSGIGDVNFRFSNTVIGEKPKSQTMAFGITRQFGWGIVSVCYQEVL